MDIAIIGAGPAGLFAAFEAGRLGLSSCIIDALDFIGGQCIALYPEKPIYDIPACPAILAKDLITNLKTQAGRFAPIYHLGQRVEKISGRASQWQLVTSVGNIIEAKAIIIAAGCGAFGPNRPRIEGIEQYEGKTVFYLVHRPEDFAGKKVVIAGGGDSAADWAIALAGVAKNVYLVHRRDKFRCTASSTLKLRQMADVGSLEIVTPYHLHDISGSGGMINKVILRSLAGSMKEIEADILLPFFGLSMDLGPIAGWGLDIERKRIKVSPETLVTSTPGIYAIGDVVTYPGKLKLILSAFAEAAMACRSIYSLVHPDNILNFEYSTNSGVFDEAL
ncbi:ferredoxin--NADP reductase [Rickettsiales bacterium]|nr:ferredoxin--NADP reductase [Rickettsiales bacterium]